MSAICGVSTPPPNSTPQPLQSATKPDSKSSQANTVSPVTEANAAKAASSHVIDVRA